MDKSLVPNWLINPVRQNLTTNKRSGFVVRVYQKAQTCAKKSERTLAQTACTGIRGQRSEGPEVRGMGAERPETRGRSSRRPGRASSEKSNERLL